MISRVWIWVGALVVVAVGVIAFVSLGRGSTGPPRERVQSWVKSTNLGQDVGTLEGDGASVRRALSARAGIATVHTVCAAMATDAETYNQNLPSPDTVLTRLLASAYALEYDAAESCYRAPAVGSRLLSVSARDRAQATGVFRRALRRVRELTGRDLPTTTTTVPDLTGTSLF